MSNPRIVVEVEHHSSSADNESIERSLAVGRGALVSVPVGTRLCFAWVDDHAGTGSHVDAAVRFAG